VGLTSEKAEAWHPNACLRIRAGRRREAIGECLHALRAACWEVGNKLTEERRTNRALVREAKAGQVSIATQSGPPVTYLTRAEQYKSVAALAASEQFKAQIHSQVLQTSRSGSMKEPNGG